MLRELDASEQKLMAIYEAGRFYDGHFIFFTNSGETNYMKNTKTRVNTVCHYFVHFLWQKRICRLYWHFKAVAS